MIIGTRIQIPKTQIVNHINKKKKNEFIGSIKLYHSLNSIAVTSLFPNKILKFKSYLEFWGNGQTNSV